MVTANSEEAKAYEWDRLASALNHYGIDYLAPQKRIRWRSPSDVDLFDQLARARSVRLQEGFTTLLLLHPEISDAARQAIERLDGDTRVRAMRRYVAAAALQRMWWTRLRTELGTTDQIPPSYLNDLELPDLDRDFGETALLDMSNREEETYGYDAWNGYNSLMDLFLSHYCSGWRKRPRAASR